MSAIASFYLVRNEDIARLKIVAMQPVGPVAGRNWHDPYWEFLSANTRELEEYGWSGYVISSEVYFYLQSRSVTLDDYCDQDISDFLCKARESTILVFRELPAKELAGLIEHNWPAEATLTAFLNTPDMKSPVSDVVPTESVFDGLAVLKSWLSQVDEGNVGLLSIG